MACPDRAEFVVALSDVMAGIKQLYNRFSGDMIKTVGRLTRSHSGCVIKSLLAT